MSAPPVTQDVILPDTSVSILWQGKLFGCCDAVIYTIGDKPDLLQYELADSIEDFPVAVINFRPVYERGDIAIYKKVPIQELVDNLLLKLEERYIVHTCNLYKREIHNEPRH